MGSVCNRSESCVQNVYCKTSKEETTLDTQAVLRGEY
jgi:hypothetical protein